MTTRNVDRIEEFPKDGKLWWVRWVDRYHVPKGGTATPGVEVLLSPLDLSLSELRKADLLEIAAPRNLDPQLVQAPIPAFTGYIPRLPLGTIFLDGVEVASIPFKQFEFDLPEFTLSVRRINDELPNKPDWWKYPYRVINRSDYHLGGFPGAANSHAVVIESKNAIVVIPCHEIFRTMYAPHSEIARALTSGPWELTKSSVIAPERTGERIDGQWQVTLRRRIQDDLSDLLANICLSPTGKAAANSIYTGLISSNGPGYLNARIPFELNTLRIKVKGLKLEGKRPKYLALQIVAMEWPNAPTLVSFRDNDGTKGKSQTPIDKSHPFSTATAYPTADEDGIIDTNSQEDPLESSAVTTFTIPGVDWSNRPIFLKEQKEESFIYAGPHSHDAEDDLEGVSPGTSTGGESNSGTSTYTTEPQQKRDTSKRLSEVVKLFDRLVSSGALEHWSITPHPRPLLHSGTLALWHLPLRAKDTKQFLSFGYLDRKTQQRRGALVCELQYKGNKIYWLDIDARQHEAGRKALVYAVAPEAFITSTLRLLEIAARNRGTWMPNEELVRFARIKACEAWVHSFVNKSEENLGGELNDARAMATIAHVAEASHVSNARQNRA